MNYYYFLFAIIFTFYFDIAHAQYKDDDDIIIANSQFQLTLSGKGYAKSLICKTSGEECLLLNRNVPLCSITQYRPYDNENFLMFPAKPRTFPSNRITRIGDTIRVEFKDTYDIAYIELKITDSYIGFNLSKINYRIENFGVKRKTEIDEFALCQLPIKQRTNFGEWLNVMWDKNTAINVLATSPSTRIDAFNISDGMTMYAGLDNAVKLFNSGAALIVTSKDNFLNCVEQVEQDYKLPLGCQSRRNKEYLYSYYELRNVTIKNIDENIRLAKKAGFKAMVVYYSDFAKGCGHYQWNDEYPNGIDDLKIICDKIRVAGIIPGLHIHYSKVAVTDPYINNGVPDSRLNVVRELILSNSIGNRDSVIFIENNPEGLRMEQDRRLIRIDDELIMYSNYSSSKPYKLTGCQRGVYNTTPAVHEAYRYAQLLDVDDWPLFIRINQDTNIQQEIADRLGEIYTKVGFNFVYFDGAEDVPMPYWYNVSKSQLTVFNQLIPAPLFSEGALKSHFGWHILTRGNAFDIFPPEKIRQAMKKYTLRCASQTSNDFTSVNFGWVNYIAPQAETMGMQPDMFEYICSKALAWNAPMSLIANLDDIKRHPRTEDNFEVIRQWETAKLKNVFTERQKELLKNPDKEYLLLVDNTGKYNIYEYKKIEITGSKALCAYLFNRNGKTCIIYWNINGEDCTLSLPIDSRRVKLYDTHNRPCTVYSRGGNTVVPFNKRIIMETNLAPNGAELLFRQAKLIYKK